MTSLSMLGYSGIVGCVHEQPHYSISTGQFRYCDGVCKSKELRVTSTMQAMCTSLHGRIVHGHECDVANSTTLVWASNVLYMYPVAFHSGWYVLGTVLAGPTCKLFDCQKLRPVCKTSQYV